VSFVSIYPGWYAGRTIHIHCKLFLKEQLAVTTQLYLPQPINNEVHADNVPYQKRFPIPMSNDDDMIFRDGGHSTTLKARKTESKVMAELTMGIKQG
jgi:protocatechuate 3,4-dioxygenase beta subunit